jgi:hypothetical protein
MFWPASVPVLVSDVRRPRVDERRQRGDDEAGRRVDVSAKENVLRRFPSNIRGPLAMKDV